MNAFVLPLILMIVVMLAELLLLNRLRSQAIPWLDVISNLNSGHLVLWLFRGAEVAAYAWVSQHANLGLTDGWHSIAVWVFAFFAWDFGFYWLHRLHHKIGWLWAVHEVHHQGEHFNLSLGIRNSWYSSLTSFPFFALLAVAGIPLHVFVAVSSFHYAVQFYNHSGLVTRSGVLDRLLITPLHHRVHHGANPEYIDKNFGGTLLLWDRLFGTFQRKIAGVEIQYGTPHAQYSHNPFWANQLPLLRYLGLCEPRLRTRQVETAQVAFVASGGLLLFAIVIYYVGREGSWVGPQQAWLFGLVALATLALGGMSDGRPWATAAWLAVGLGIPAMLIGVLGLHDPLGCVPMAGLGAHAAAFSGWRWRRLAAARPSSAANEASR